MTADKRLGQILIDTGRLSEDDTARALEYQREHGGYFGEALLALGLATEQEVEWSLASQYDLPYVFPDPETIDREAASLVSAEWALAHLTLPIARTDDAITVVVDSPVKTEAVEELSARTDRPIELALAPASQIRVAIRQVYGRNASVDDADRGAPVALREAMALALDAASSRFGISTRRRKAWFWYDDGGTVRRRLLEGAWEIELDQVVDPAPSDQHRGKDRAVFEARMVRGGIPTPVEVRFLEDDGGQEMVFRPVLERSSLHDRFPPPPGGVLSEVRLLTASGSARFLVTSEPDTLGREVLPHLPILLLDPSWRSVHVDAGGRESAEEAFSVSLPSATERWTEELDGLRGFCFDVVTVDLDEDATARVGDLADVARVAFLHWPAGASKRPAIEAGIRWELHVARNESGRMTWSLDPLRG